MGSQKVFKNGKFNKNDEEGDYSKKIFNPLQGYLYQTGKAENMLVVAGRLFITTPNSVECLTDESNALDEETGDVTLSRDIVGTFEFVSKHYTRFWDSGTGSHESKKVYKTRACLYKTGLGFFSNFESLLEAPAIQMVSASKYEILKYFRPRGFRL